MGRSSHPPVIKHKSHLHPLQLSPQHLSCSSMTCAACGNPTTASAPTYTCKTCNYTLHASCASFPYSLCHPSHPSHELHLLFSPAYLEGSFDCDACGLPGKSFSYNCHDCTIDLHPHCALLPSSFIHPSHFHPLSLSFHSPYADDGFICDVCGSPGGRRRWLYRCYLGCEFDAHLGCIVAAAPSSGVRLQQVAPPGQHLTPNSLPATWHPAPLPEKFTGGGYIRRPNQLCELTGNGSKDEVKYGKESNGEETSETETFSTSSPPESATGDKISSSSREGNNCEAKVCPQTELKERLAISRRRWRAFRQ